MISKERSGGFAERVLAIVRRIPVGRVATYGDVARLAGRPRAHRAVGNIMRECRLPDVPCHRVIGAGGLLGGYGGNLELKRNLLRAEGLAVGLRRVREFEQHRWTVGGSRSRGAPKDASRRTKSPVRRTSSTRGSGRR